MRAPARCTVSSRLPLWILAATAGFAVPPPCAQSAAVARDGGTTYRPFQRDKDGRDKDGRDKDVSCAQRAHERVKALMAGIPWVRSDGRPAAKNRQCK